MRNCGLLRVSLLLLCALMSTISFAQERKISGTITDDKQVPLSRATVTVKGTNVATTTDGAGKFSLNLPANKNILVISYVGMQSSEVTVGASDAVNVSLQPGTGTDRLFTDPSAGSNSRFYRIRQW